MIRRLHPGIDGKTVAGFEFGRHSFDGNQFAVALNFSDSSRGVYLGDMGAVPEPAPAVFLLAVSLVATGLYRKRRFRVCSHSSW